MSSVSSRTRSETFSVRSSGGYFFTHTLAVLIVALLLLGGGQGGTTEMHAAAPADSTGLRLYVPNQRGASISVLDGTGKLLETVDLTEYGFSKRAMPHQVVVAPDGNAWYVTLVGERTVAKFNRDHELVAKATFEAPGMIGLDPVRDRVYVSRALSVVSPPTSLGVFRASDLTLLQETDIFVSRPHALAVDSITGRVYSASLSGSRIAALDPMAGEVEVTNVEGLSGGFVGLDTSPDGTRLVATTQQTDQLLAFDTDSLALKQVAAVSVAAGPYDVRYSPDGRSVWFPNQEANTVTQVSTHEWAVTGVVESDGFAQPHGVVVTPDSRTVYVTSHGMSGLEAAPANGTLAVIDATSGSVKRITEVGPYAAAPGLARP